MTSAPEDRVDHLYELPLDEFTAARNALAAELRKAGDGEAAAEVKSLRKPSRAAWAVNRLVRAEPELVEALMGAGGELRQAHRQAAAGRGAQQLRAAAEAEREAIERLLAKLPAVLGGPPSAAQAETIRDTLHAASSDDEARELIAAGRVVEDMRPVGLGPVPAGTGRAPRRRAGPESEAAAEREAKEAAAEHARRLAEARSREKALLRENEAAERSLARAEDALTRAREASEAAAARAGDARKRMRAAREGLRQAQKNLERLRRTG